MEPTVYALLSDRGWILERLAQEISKVYPNFSYGTEQPSDVDIVYYMTYSSRKQPFDGVEIGYFTHIEEGLPAEKIFYDVAESMDACVTQACLYKSVLNQRGIENVHTIPCGIDHNEFTPRLQIGVVGRTYHTGRKGERLIAELMDMEHVQFHFTGDGWPGTPLHIEHGKMGDFYRAMDYVLVPSLYEGGPMCVPEALACGVPVIAPEIGWVSDFPHISFEKGNVQSLRVVLEGLVQEKLNLAKSASEYTWERWAQSHVKLFRETWNRCGKTKESAVSLKKTMKHAKIMQVLHGGELNSKGGPSVRIPYTAEMLSKTTANTGLSYGIPKADGLDIAHLYNIWQPDSALATLKGLKSKTKNRVFSPILLDLNYRHFWGDVLPDMVKRTPLGASRFLSCLPDIQVAYERALEKREAAILGYQPVPGFAAKLRALVHEAEHLVFLSDYEKSLIETYVGPVKNSTVLRNPVDADFFRPNRKCSVNLQNHLNAEFGIGEGDPFMLSVGRVEVRKNQLMKAAIARELRVPLLIVGHFGDQSYADLVKDAGGGYVYMLGRIEPHSEELLWLYQNCALFLSLSWAEGASLSILEAASAGAPLLLTDLSSEREYFDGIASFTPPLDLEIAVATAKREIKIKSKRKSRSQHLFIKDKYDWPAHISSLTDIYKRLL